MDRESVEQEAARRGVSPGFIRAEMVQNLRKGLLGGRRLNEPLTKHLLVRTGQHFWPYTYAKSPSYEGAVNALFTQARDWAESEQDLAAWSAVEGLEVPDAHIHLMGSCRWMDQGLPVVIVGERYAAALMSTSVPKEILPEVKAPWKAFLIEIPPLGLVTHGHGDESGEIRRVLVWCESRSSMEGRDGWAYFTMCEDSPLSLWFMDSLEKLSEDVDITSEWDALPFGLAQDDRDKRIRTLLHRLILNTCLAMSNPANLKLVGNVHKRAWTGPTPRTLRGDPTFRHFQLGTPIKVDCRQSVRDYVEGSRKAALTVQFMVRGHWKQQPHGPQRSLRKLIWVEPYWKGEEDAPVLVRDHDLA